MTFNDLPEEHKKSAAKIGLPLIWVAFAALLSIYLIDPIQIALRGPIDPTEWLHVKRIVISDYPENTIHKDVQVIYDRDIKMRNVSVWNATVVRLDGDNMPEERLGNNVYCSGSGRFDYNPEKVDKPLGPVSVSLDKWVGEAGCWDGLDTGGVYTCHVSYSMRLLGERLEYDPGPVCSDFRKLAAADVTAPTVVPAVDDLIEQQQILEKQVEDLKEVVEELTK